MNICVLDGLEFEAEMSYTAGSPGKYSGPPEDCYPAEPDECEFLDYGPFHSMFDAVYVACWMFECPMTEEDMQKLANDIEEKAIEDYLADPPVYEPEPPDEEDYECEWP